MDWNSIKKSEENNTYKIPDNWLFTHYFEAFNMLFKLENALRIFVYVILKEEFKDKWTDTALTSDDNSKGSINSISKARKSQIEKQSYLGYVIDHPIVYLTTGELIGIILADAYRGLFKKHFKGNKAMIEYKLSELGLFRNSLAHFRPIKSEDIDYFKHIIQQLFDEINKSIYEILHCNKKLPENYDSERYKEFKEISLNGNKISLNSSKSDEWIKISIIYKTPSIKKNKYGEDYFVYQMINLNGTKVCNKFEDLCNKVIYIRESINYPDFNEKEEELSLFKVLSFVISKQSLDNDAEAIIKNIQDIVDLIIEEEEKIKTNPNISGEIMEISRSSVYKKEGEKRFSFNYSDLEGDPSNCKRIEYRGDYEIYSEDFIANADRYPWINIKTGFEPLPF